MRPVPAATALAAVGLVLFFAYHWLMVAPVWAVLVEGIVWVLLTGGAVGWAFQRSVLDEGRNGVTWGFRFGALRALVLVPGLVVGLVHGPFPNGPTVEEILPILPLAFLGVPVSLVAAWGLGSWRRLSWPFVVAALPTGIMVGGSLATFGGTVDLFLLFVGLELAAGAALALWVAPPPETRAPSPA